MFWVTYRLPPGVDYGTKVSSVSGWRLCPSCILEFRLTIPLGPSSIIWESQFTVESGSHNFQLRVQFLIFMIFFTNHGQCMAYDKRPSPIFAGTMQMQYNLKVTSTMPIWIRYGIVYVYCYGNLFLSITEFMEYKIKYTIISVRTIWFRWKLPMSPEVEFMTT